MGGRMSITGKTYWRGFRDGAPFILVIAPFGLLFGVIATEAGFNLFETMSMTVLVIAGAAQFAAIQMLMDNAPVVVIVLTGLAINLRMAMYSASLTPHLGTAPIWQRALIAYGMVDQAYGVSIVKYEAEPEMPTAQKVAYYFGVISPVVPLWYLSTMLGALLGSAIPDEYALDFAIPITFLAMVAPALRSLPHVGAAVVSVTVSLALSWLPYNLWLMIAAVLAMMTGAALEKWQEGRT